MAARGISLARNCVLLFQHWLDFNFKLQRIDYPEEKDTYTDTISQIVIRQSGMYHMSNGSVHKELAYRKKAMYW